MLGSQFTKDGEDEVEERGDSIAVVADNGQNKAVTFEDSDRGDDEDLDDDISYVSCRCGNQGEVDVMELCRFQFLKNRDSYFLAPFLAIYLELELKMESKRKRSNFPIHNSSFCEQAKRITIHDS